jgi:hypothetical protein
MLPSSADERMPGSRPQGLKTKLALAIAEGMSVAAWARKNDVPKRTAYAWANLPQVRAAAESYRHRAVDRAIGRMARRVTWAADGIAKLAKGAESESVRLAALRAILADMMTVSSFSGLERRLTQIEEQLRDRADNADRPC